MERPATRSGATARGPSGATISKVDGYAFPFPVAKAGGFGALGTAAFRRQFLGGFLGAAGFGFRLGALPRLSDAPGNRRVDIGLIGHSPILHLEGPTENP